MSAVYCSIFSGNYPDLNQGIVHPLRVPHFFQHYELVCDDMSLNVAKKARQHWIVGLETAEGIKGGCQHPSNKFEILWQVVQTSFLSYFHVL